MSSTRQNSKSVIYYIENLTVDSWIFFILPYFLKDRMKISQEVCQGYYFNNSKCGLWLANFTSWFTKIQLERINFNQGDARNQDGHLIWMETIRGTLSICDHIKNNFDFQRVIVKYGKANSLHLFLNKWVMHSDLITTDTFLMQKLIFLVLFIQQREYLNDTIRVPGRDVFFFMQERPWLSEIGKFAKSKGINVIPGVSFNLYIKIFFLQFDNIKFFVKELCKKVVYDAMVIRYKLKERLQLKKSEKSSEIGEAIKNDCKRFEKYGPRIAIEHYGCLNFDSPGMFSDLFFFQKSFLFAQDVLIYFGLPQIPITSREWNDIGKRGMSAVATNPQATATPEIPLFIHKRKRINMDWFNNEAKDKKNIFTYRWLQRYVLNYRQRYNYWVDFIAQYNVKMHVTWHKYSSDHCAKLDALKDTGGVGIVYQRSFDYFLAPWTFTTADVVFGFSEFGAHIGRDKESIIPYYVVTGYLGDHRFGLLKELANTVRQSIISHGAQRIMAYFDEHASDHSRWDLAYKVTLKNYSYLLNKVLENPWFGLILKPKVPSTLRSKRLEPISELLCQAEKTGRCFIFEETSLQSSYSPAVASLGADVAIHGHLFAATAGVESALTGTPTLFLDSEGALDNSLDILGDGRVIFKDIESLWRSCVEHWNRPGGIPGFADWSGILNELDPFRDGRAAERMGMYLGWLMEGFKTGLARETVLADAAERYVQIWGKDKILSVNVSPRADFNKIHVIQK